MIKNIQQNQGSCVVYRKLLVKDLTISVSYMIHNVNEKKTNRRSPVTVYVFEITLQCPKISSKQMGVSPMHEDKKTDRAIW